MSLDSILMRLNAGRNDRKRDRAIPLPQGVREYRDLSYGPHKKWHLLDVSIPTDVQGSLPTIVSIHGGGYVYGSKEIYRRYCMDLARRGFAVVNFNYRLAPRWRFPAPLEDTNAVMAWICANASKYQLDPQRLFLVGDSAGAQITSQYAAISANSAYAALFPFSVPQIRIRALGLNCGMYDAAALAAGKRESIAKDYLGTKLEATDPRLQVLAHITPDYPPAHITTACHDFLRDHAQPMADFLRSKGIPTQLDCYGTEEDDTIGHVFHINILLPEAIACNDAQCAFFEKHMDL